MFKSFWGSQKQEAQPRPQEIPTDSWYPQSVLSSQNSSRPRTPNNSSSNSFSVRPGDRPQSLFPVSPAKAAGIIVYLKDKSVDELRRLLADKDAYHRLLLSLDMVRTQNHLDKQISSATIPVGFLVGFIQVSWSTISTILGCAW